MSIPLEVTFSYPWEFTLYMFLFTLLVLYWLLLSSHSRAYPFQKALQWYMGSEYDIRIGTA